MLFVNLDTLIQFMYYDEKTQNYKTIRGTIKEFLQTFSNYENIPLIEVNNNILGKYYDKKDYKDTYK